MATADDVPDLVRMYQLLSAEQAAIREVWPYADGLPEPISGTFEALLADADARVVVGEIDGVALGFLVAGTAPLLEPRSSQRIGVVRLIFTEPDARGVGVGATMLTTVLDEIGRHQIELFDALVSPGHRAAKNFFESNGFKARSITMHRAGPVQMADPVSPHRASPEPGQ